MYGSIWLCRNFWFWLAFWAPFWYFIGHQLSTDYGLHSIALGSAAIKSHHSVSTGTNEAWSLKDLFFMVDWCLRMQTPAEALSYGRHLQGLPGLLFTLSLPAPRSPVVNSERFNNVAFSLCVGLPGNIYRSFLLYSAIYFLKVCRNLSDFVKHVRSWPPNSKVLLWRCRGNWSLNTQSVDVYLASIWSEAKRIHHIPAFFSKTQLSIYWGEKNTKSCYLNINRMKQTVPLPLLKCPLHFLCLLDNSFFLQPQTELLCSHTLLMQTTSSHTLGSESLALHYLSSYSVPHI